MSIRFAAARAGRALPVHAWLCRSVSLDPANDNQRPPFGDLAVLAALRHFGRHGLGAGEEARLRAEQARRDGDAAALAEWLRIYRQFDRRGAQALARDAL